MSIISSELWNSCELYRRRFCSQYRHNKYEEGKVEGEIDKLKEEIRILGDSNTEKTNLVTNRNLQEMKKISKENDNLRKENKKFNKSINMLKERL